MWRFEQHHQAKPTLLKASYLFSTTASETSAADNFFGQADADRLWQTVCIKSSNECQFNEIALLNTREVAFGPYILLAGQAITRIHKKIVLFLKILAFYDVRRQEHHIGT